MAYGEIFDGHMYLNGIRIPLQPGWVIYSGPRPDAQWLPATDWRKIDRDDNLLHLERRIPMDIGESRHERYFFNTDMLQICEIVESETSFKVEFIGRAWSQPHGIARWYG